MNMDNIELHLYLQLDRRQKSKRNARVNTSHREQYRGTVHLFIAMVAIVFLGCTMPYTDSPRCWESLGVDSYCPRLLFHHVPRRAGLGRNILLPP
jgi:hypothetical protein